jgi:hypothetical protein
MVSLEFSSSTHKWGYGLAIIYCLIVAVACLWISLRYSNVKPAVAGLLLGGFGICFFWWQNRQMTGRVVLSDAQIEAWTLGGKDKIIPWSEITEIRQFFIATRHGPIKAVRLNSFHPSKQIFLTDQMPGFDKIMQRILLKAPHARTSGKVTVGERILWGAYAGRPEPTTPSA